MYLDGLRGFYMGVIWVLVGFLGFGNQNFFGVGCFVKCALYVCRKPIFIFKEIYLHFFAKNVKKYLHM